MPTPHISCLTHISGTGACVQLPPVDPSSPPNFLYFPPEGGTMTLPDGRVVAFVPLGTPIPVTLTNPILLTASVDQGHAIADTISEENNKARMKSAAPGMTEVENGAGDRGLEHGRPWNENCKCARSDDDGDPNAPSSRIKRRSAVLTSDPDVKTPSPWSDYDVYELPSPAFEPFASANLKPSPAALSDRPGRSLKDSLLSGQLTSQLAMNVGLYVDELVPQNVPCEVSEGASSLECGTVSCTAHNGSEEMPVEEKCDHVIEDLQSDRSADMVNFDFCDPPVEDEWWLR